MPQMGEIIKGYLINENKYQKYIWVRCDLCGGERWTNLYQLKLRRGLCRSCSAKLVQNRPYGVNHHWWKGGRWIDKLGYVVIHLSKDDPFYNMTYRGKIREHRLVMAKHLERCLYSWEIIHHINGDKSDNRIENLRLVTFDDHFPTIMFLAMLRNQQAKIAKQVIEIQHLRKQLSIRYCNLSKIKRMKEQIK